MFGSKPELPAQVMEFRSFRKTDHETLHAIQTSVEEGYINGIPKHHLLSAFNEENTKGASCIFICSYSEYIDLPIPRLQKIMRDRHILITNVPISGIRFNLNGLQTIGDVHEKRSIQSELETAANLVTIKQKQTCRGEARATGPKWCRKPHLRTSMTNQKNQTRL
jgi:hypothetical protein